MDHLFDELKALLGQRLFQLIINPKTERPYLLNSLKNRRDYSSLSGGEKTLVLLAYDLYNGSGKSNLYDLNCLDHDGRMRALRSIENFLKIPR